MDVKTQERIFVNYLIVALISATVNVLFCTNKMIGYATILAEISVLFMKFLRQDIVDYIAYYVIFVANCLEFYVFASAEEELHFYNLKDFRLLGLNLAAWLLLPLLIKFISKPIPIGKLKNKQRDFYKMGTRLIIINIVATVIGGLLIFFNDNGIQGLANLVHEYLGAIYTMMFIPLTMFCGFAMIVIKQENYMEKVALALQATFFATVFQMILSYTTKIYGYYGGVPTLLVSMVNFVIPLMLLLFLDKDEIVFPRITQIVALLGTALVLFFNTNGKHIIIVAMLLPIIFWRLLASKKCIVKLLAVISMVMCIVAIPVLLMVFAKNSIIFRAKLQSVIGLFNFGNDWRNNIPVSPRIRIEEYIDVAIECFNKPWLIITGKGYLGSIINHTGYFVDNTMQEGAFSDQEWNNGTFYNLHEMAKIFVMYGVMGIVYYIGLFKTMLRRQKKNIWMLIGGIWFFVLYGYSFTLSVFGFAALFYGLCNQNTNLIIKGQR